MALLQKFWLIKLAVFATLLHQLHHTTHAVDGRLSKGWHARGKNNQWRGDEEGDHKVEGCGQTQGEGKSLDLTHGKEVNHHCTQQCHHIASNNRAFCTLPRTWSCRTEGSAFTDLILDALIEHHEGVSGGTDTNDQTGNTCKIQGVSDPTAKQDQRTVDQNASCEQGE